MTSTARLSTLARFAAGIVIVVLANSSAFGQDPAWRTDYNQARREATEKGKPVLLEFVSDNCLWCKKLESTTLRDPSIASVLSEQFVPIKLDPQHDFGLTQRLQITSFPTMILAAPDGRIITIVEGFVEPGKLLIHLQGAVAACQTTPEWMTRDLQDASKAVGANDYARAISLLKGITQDGRDRPVQIKAREQLRTLEQQAETRLVNARRMDDRGQGREAVATLTDLVRTYPGTAAATEAKVFLTSLAGKQELLQKQRSRQAAEILAQAKEEYQAQRFFNCLEKCQSVESNFADCAEASEAARIASHIRNNPEWLALESKTLSDRLSNMYLVLADSWLKKGKPELAVSYLEKVQQLSPGSANAQIALARLSQIQGKVSQQTECKKP
jgi:thioredoxin-related protein